MKLKKLLSTLSVMMLTFSFSMSNSVAVHANDTDISNFSYTGAVQTFTAPYSGKYKLEVWGSQGGNDLNGQVGGKGGYSYGEVNLTPGQKLYVYVGGQGTYASTSSGNFPGGWNGGGNSLWGAGGGGATDIRTASDGNWQSNLSSRIIVAGSGGGSAGYHNSMMLNGGAGGGINGINGIEDSGYKYVIGGGGSQTIGGSADPGWCTPGSLGKGGNTKAGACGGAGGGGYYGGGGGTVAGGGGGSGYIGTLASANTIAGNQSFESPSGTTEIGQSGNGYARITHVASYANGITINKRADDLEVGETDKLTARVIPDNASVKTVKWTSSDSSVVTVDDNGNILAVKAGIAIITATVQDGRNLHGQCRVCVTN